MSRLFGIICLFTLISSCTNKQKQIDNEKNILGNWLMVKSTGNPDAKGDELDLSYLYTPGFCFYSNHTFDNMSGYYKDVSEKSFVKNLYLGTISKYKIRNDSLLLFSPNSNKWNNYKLLELTPNSLKFGTERSAVTYKHFIVKKNRNPQFDRIILATSGCFLVCPIVNIDISANGNVLFKEIADTANTGLYSGKIPTKQFQALQDNFRMADFDSLKNDYTSGVSDQRAVSVTFIKNGKIYKSISDYGGAAPQLFSWGYVPLEYLYQTIPLKKISGPDFIPNFKYITDSWLKRRDIIAELKQSETFLLMDYLRMGTITKTDFTPSFKLHTYFQSHSIFDIDTDGRYYKFVVNGKSKTIDIGFNFYDVNEKNWVWRKACENE